MNLAVVSNPRRRKRRVHHKRRAAAPRRKRRVHHKRRRRHSPVRVIHMRRNPSRRRRHKGMSRRVSGHAMTGLLIPGTLGAVGALGFDWVYGKVSGYLPATFQGNYWITAGIKILAAVGIARYGSKFTKRDTAHAIAAGVAVVTLYDVGQIAMGTLLAPAAAPVTSTGTKGLGYVGTGMSIGTPGGTGNTFLGERIGIGERVGIGEYGGYTDTGMMG